LFSVKEGDLRSGWVDMASGIKQGTLSGNRIGVQRTRSRRDAAACGRALDHAGATTRSAAQTTEARVRPKPPAAVLRDYDAFSALARDPTTRSCSRGSANRSRRRPGARETPLISRTIHLSADGLTAVIAADLDGR
jgi:hypothetical protein